jgi:hypothetical protein
MGSKSLKEEKLAVVCFKHGNLKTAHTVVKTIRYRLVLLSISEKMTT